MKFKIVFILILFTSISLAQETIYFDRAFHKRTFDPDSENKRIYFVIDSLIEVKDYKSDRLYRTGKFYGFKNLKNLDEFIWYHYNM